MTQFAFDEFRQLVAKLTLPSDTTDPTLRYVCALVAELTYRHVPSVELDGRKRAKLLVPSLAYRTLLTRMMRTDVAAYLRAMDFMPAPGTGRFYVTAVTHQGQRRYGRQASRGVLTGRDPGVLPDCE